MAFALGCFVFSHLLLELCLQKESCYLPLANLFSGSRMYYTLIYLKYNTDLAFLSPPYAVMLNKEDVRKIRSL